LDDLNLDEEPDDPGISPVHFTKTLLQAQSLIITRFILNVNNYLSLVYAVGTCFLEDPGPSVPLLAFRLPRLLMFWKPASLGRGHRDRHIDGDFL
jgi:hypothetical protein